MAKDAFRSVPSVIHVNEKNKDFLEFEVVCKIEDFLEFEAVIRGKPFVIYRIGTEKEVGFG